MSAPRTFATASLRGHEHKFLCSALATAQNAATPIHGGSKILWGPHRRLLPRSSDQAVRWCLGALLKGPLGARLGLRSLGLRLCVLSFNKSTLIRNYSHPRGNSSRRNILKEPGSYPLRRQRREVNLDPIIVKADLKTQETSKMTDAKTGESACANGIRITRRMCTSTQPGDEHTQPPNIGSRIQSLNEGN